MELRCSRLLTGQLTKWILRSYFRSFSGKVQSQDPYKCLGVAPSASAKEIKAAFFKKSMELHPDRNSSPTANQDFGKVAEAYALLSDCEKRKDFDKKHNVPGGHDEQFERIKRDFESRSGAPHTSHQREERYQRQKRERFNGEKMGQGVIPWCFFWWVFLRFFVLFFAPKKPFTPPVKRDKGDEFIRRNYEELAPKEAQNQPKADVADDHKRNG